MDGTTSFGSSLSRLWPLVLMLALIGAVVGVIAGLVASATYTSSATFAVGTPAVTAQAVPGYVQATQSLAANYALAAQTPQVLVPAARQAGVSAAAASSRLSFSELPSSNLITVRGTGSTSHDAQRIAQAGAQALSAYVSRTQSQGSTPGLTRSYHGAQVNLLRLQAQLRSLQSLPSGKAPPDQALVDLRAKIAAAQLRVQGLGSEFIQTELGNQSAAGLQLLSPAGTASSNRSSIVQKTAFVGLIAGLLIAVIVVYVLDARRRRPSTVTLG